MKNNTLLDLISDNFDYNVLNKKLNQIEGRRFVASVVRQQIVLNGHSMGYQGDDLYCKWSAKLTYKNGEYVVKIHSDLYSKDRSGSTLYSSYDVEDSIDKQVTLVDEQQLIDFLDNKALSRYFVREHDWTIYLV